ncbi:3-hydroxyisobutyryl-CoA hydrolase 1-like isoform X2 [Cajanus cajan]|uniref:3-hydroxyisobutyryl-CoA hydrolase 1-like isoform X2 n=1 Tax=Cajanus cajan TaxID=3821 RepID=UPI0010FB7D59|nr:3-hydroxyisobutyryl-CoA hydrolase 1-like isoform X2 [Cajanus cajan]
MALSLNFDRQQNQVLFIGNSCVKVVILNRPQKLNSLSHEMNCQIKKNLELYENDPSVQLVILKGNERAFCSGADLVSLITSSALLRNHRPNGPTQFFHIFSPKL